ncbi:hypothetical protein [Ruminiclostridium cellobioparum]|uniref:Putative Fe-S oxidoreductase n=1 Tax=Ruminiclostridium cellobioparum subsp. termitidis CT1112 TaxID=1195236 RepID=S0FQK8_RUMCE|nr:hypothetical protein [Ruminiclostridium cellobioparum]EMS71449.1 putative Fe-S oxidoreductase [Ruminiclostridium cellobioparum subsp. termitidis CT1112]
MFINEVITKIWEPVSLQYEKTYKEASLLNTEELFNLIKENIEEKINYIRVINTPDFSITALATSGCPHCNKNGKFAACSMCDYSSPHAIGIARMDNLKHRSPELYAQIVRLSFEQARGVMPESSILESITTYDSLNSEEVTDEVFDEVFGKGELFKGKPFKLGIETRASSVTQSKLVKWKEKLGKRVRVEIGVEVKNDWIRNNWINKNITNDHIKNAVELIIETGWEPNGNVLIGIPGLTEEQSIELFYETVIWMDQLGFKYIICSPVAIKEMTLQGFIYRELRENESLVDLGVVYGEQTGMPWIFTVVRAIHAVISRRPDLARKLILSEVNFPNYYNCIEPFYNKNGMSNNMSDIKKSIREFALNKDPKVIIDLYSNMQEHPYYTLYQNILDKQKKYSDIKTVISKVGEEISKLMWPDNWHEKVSELKEELGKLTIT